MEPTADIEALWAIERRLYRTKAPSRRKAERVVPVSELYALGYDLMSEAALCHEPDPSAAARKFRDGLMIALLAARPIRMRNLRNLHIGKNLIKQNGTFYLTFREDETKTHKALEFPLPDGLSCQMAIYLSTYRPILVQGTMLSHLGEHCAVGEALWVSPFATAITNATIYTTIVDATRKHFGHPVNPHLFRDCAATSIALEDPEHVRITASILGHTTLATSQRYYNHAQAVRAIKAHQVEILAARKAYTKELARGRLVNSRRRKDE